MSYNTSRFPLRNRPAQRKVVDENATSRHTRQPSGIAAVSNASKLAHSVVNGIKGGVTRQALGEVTATTVNRNKESFGAKETGKEKENIESGLKRIRSSSLAAASGPQRVPLGPGRAQAAPTVSTAVHARAPLARAQRTTTTARRVSRVVPKVVAPVVVLPEEVPQYEDHDMEVELIQPPVIVADPEPIYPDQDVVAMIEAMTSNVKENEDEIEQTARLVQQKAARVWPEVSTEKAVRYRREIDAIRETFEDEADILDPTMVSEYAEEIFEYMDDLEEEVMPSADYMSGQNEITWAMRQTLVDWLLQIHLRYHLLPETLWIAINIVDRFLTKRVVSLVKLQLVGVTALFIAAKYEEILAPSVEEFVFMTEKGYLKEEILKGECIVLQTLDFKISHYCSPYSWMRKISKADDYEIQTRTLSKFLTEVTLLDHRFLRVKPSMVAAIGMYTARRMLGGDWNESFVFYSGYTEEQVIPGHNLLVDKLLEEGFSRNYVCKKYANKKFLKASVYAIDWAHLHFGSDGGMGSDMFFEQ